MNLNRHHFIEQNKVFMLHCVRCNLKVIRNECKGHSN